jgi:hypothetical protein
MFNRGVRQATPWGPYQSTSNKCGRIAAARSLPPATAEEEIHHGFATPELAFGARGLLSRIIMMWNLVLFLRKLTVQVMAGRPELALKCTSETWTGRRRYAIGRQLAS